MNGKPMGNDSREKAAVQVLTLICVIIPQSSRANPATFRRKTCFGPAGEFVTRATGSRRQPPAAAPLSAADIPNAPAGRSCTDCRRKAVAAFASLCRFGNGRSISH